MHKGVCCNNAHVLLPGMFRQKRCDTPRRGFCAVRLQLMAAAFLDETLFSMTIVSALSLRSTMLTNESCATPGPPAPRGNILAVGGTSGPYMVSASTEVYTPTTGLWNPTGNLAAARSMFQTVLLRNGNVLAAGGQSANFASLASAELYSPSTYSWTPTGNLAAARYSFQTVLLPTGNVLAAGGVGTTGNALASAELYNPSTGQWTPTGPLITGRYNFQMVLLLNGNVLAAGGIGNGPGVIPTTELYNATTGRWTATGPLTTGRSQPQMALLPNGNAMIAGGFYSVGTGSAVASTELYNTTTGLWTTTGNLATARYKFQMVLLPTGNVLAAGGADSSGSALATAELYSPTTGNWTTTAPFVAREDFQMALLPNGSALAAGGTGYNSPGPLASAQVYSPAMATFFGPVAKIPGPTPAPSPPAAPASRWLGFEAPVIGVACRVPALRAVVRTGRQCRRVRRVETDVQVIRHDILVWFTRLTLSAPDAASVEMTLAIGSWHSEPRDSSTFCCIAWLAYGLWVPWQSAHAPLRYSHFQSRLITLACT